MEACDRRRVLRHDERNDKIKLQRPGRDKGGLGNMESNLLNFIPPFGNMESEIKGLWRG